MRFLKRLQTEWLWLAALLLLVSLHFWFPRLDSGFVADSYSIGGPGKKAFFQVVQDRYLFASRNSAPLSNLSYRLDNDTTLCVLGPARNPTASEWDRLLEWVAQGGSLVFAARHDAPELKLENINLEIVKDSSTADQAEKDDEAEPESKSKLAEADNNAEKPTVLHAVTSSLPGVGDAGWQSRGSVKTTPADEVLVESNGSVQAVHRRYGAGDLVVVASDFIFSNQSLVWNDNVNGVLAVRLLESGGLRNEVVFDESLNESGTPKVVSVLLTPVLRPMTIQMLIALIVFGWWRSRRFGPLLPPPVTSRHNIVDHTDALGTLYYRAREGSGALRSYLKQLVWELRIRHSKGREKRVLRPLAAHLGKTVDEIGAELREASTFAKSKHVDRNVAGQQIRKLALLRRAAAEIGLTRTRDASPSVERAKAEQ